MNTYITILLRCYLKQYFILNLPSVCQIKLPLGSEQRDSAGSRQAAISTVSYISYLRTGLTEIKGKASLNSCAQVGFFIVN